MMSSDVTLVDVYLTCGDVTEHQTVPVQLPRTNVIVVRNHDWFLELIFSK